MRTNLILIAFALATLGANAQRISEQEAMERALQYMNNGKTSAQVARMAAPVRGGSAELNPVPVGAESIYAFNLKGGGYIIASADSRTLPVLGYSDSGSIDWEQMPENMRAWLMLYDEAIATLGDRMDFKDGNRISNGTPIRNGIHTERAPVEPLIKTHWAQRAPYNDQCPPYEGIESGLHGKRCATGCVATAMAQVLNYHQWPKMLPDGLPAYETIDDCSDNWNLTWYIDSLPPVIFDWDNMLDEYNVLNADTKKTEVVGTEVQQHAVATLMRYCGQAVEMMYGATDLGSAAITKDCVYAMEKYFGYPAVTYLQRDKQYGIDEWEEIIYNELNAGRPVMYTGQMPGNEGHTFVCDGYDGEGLFHINWGWSGEFDGYYSLSVLNPIESTDANEGNGLGFTYRESALIYIAPNMEKQFTPQGHQPEFFQSEEINVDGNYVFLTHAYQGEPYTIIDYALGTIDENGRLSPLFMVHDSILYRSNSNQFIVEIDSTMFQPGDSITLYPMMRFRKPAEEWQIVPPLYSNIVVGRTDDGLFFINTPNISLGLKIKGGTITKGTGRVGEPSNLTVYISNKTAKDYNYRIAIIPSYVAQIHGNDTIYSDHEIYGPFMENNSYIKAWQDGENTFSFIPEYTGLVYIYYCIYIQDELFCYNIFPLTLTNDTLLNYEKYIENRNDYVIESDKCLYTVELCDTTDTGVPDYVIPSDSIVLNMRYFYNDELIRDTIIKDEIREFLAALPEHGGSSFNCSMMIDVSKPGYYTLESYLGDLINGKIVTSACKTRCYFRISDPTSTKPVNNDTPPGSYHDLMGRRITDTPQQDGLYINNGRKVLIKVSH